MRTNMLILCFIFSLIGFCPFSASAQEIIYDSFDDGVINTDLWGVSGSVIETGGKIVLGTEGMITALNPNLISMTFSVIGYQNINEGEHVNIHLATQTPTGDLVLVGEYIDRYSDPPFVNNYVFCQWYEDGIIDLAHLHQIDLQPAQWGVTYIFGLEYTSEGSVLVKVNGQVVYSFSVPGADIAYSKGGTKFWFRADRVEPKGGDVTAEIDWATAKELPTVEISGFPAIVISKPKKNSPYYTLNAKANPDGGTYKWEIVSGQDKIRFITSTENDYMVIQGIAPSQLKDDVVIKLTYTINSMTAEDTHHITVQEPTTIDIVNGYPMPEGESTIYRYQANDQLNESIEIWGMEVTEVWRLAKICKRALLSKLDRHFTITVTTDNLGTWEDELYYPSDGYVKLEQKITVEGWPVSSRCLIYYYGNETSIEGTCDNKCN